MITFTMGTTKGLGVELIEYPYNMKEHIMYFYRGSAKDCFPVEKRRGITGIWVLDRFQKPDLTQKSSNTALETLNNVPDGKYIVDFSTGKIIYNIEKKAPVALFYNYCDSKEGYGITLAYGIKVDTKEENVFYLYSKNGDRSLESLGGLSNASTNLLTPEKTMTEFGMQTCQYLLMNLGKIIKTKYPAYANLKEFIFPRKRLNLNKNSYEQFLLDLDNSLKPTGEIIVEKRLTIKLSSLIDDGLPIIKNEEEYIIDIDITPDDIPIISGLIQSGWVYLYLNLKTISDKERYRIEEQLGIKNLILVENS